MAIEIISWTGCELQTQTTPLEWLGVLKLFELRDQQEESTRNALDELVSDAGDCAECFAPDSPCRRTVTFPIDAMGERLLFDYFLRQLREADSPGDQIYRDAVAGAHVTAEWERRGGTDATHELSEPVREPLERYDGAVFDSSQMFGALFADVEGVEAVTAHGLFWRGFANDVPQVMVPRSRTLAELTALATLFEYTFRKGLTSETCSVHFFL